MTASPPTPQPMSDEQIARHLLEQVKLRMDHRLNVILERDGAEKAVTGPGVGISYLFASEIHRACERALLVLDSQAAALRGRADNARIEKVSDELDQIAHLISRPDEPHFCEYADNIREGSALLRALRSPQAQTLQADEAHAPREHPGHMKHAPSPSVGPQAPGEQWREIATTLETFLQNEGDNSDDDSAVYAGKLEDRCRALLKALPSPPGAKPAEPEGMGLTRRFSFRELTHAEADAYIVAINDAADLFETINPASDAERLRGDPGAGAMGAVLEYRDAIRAILKAHAERGA